MAEIKWDLGPIPLRTKLKYRGGIHRPSSLICKEVVHLSYWSPCKTSCCFILGLWCGRKRIYVTRSPVRYAVHNSQGLYGSLSNAKVWDSAWNSKRYNRLFLQFQDILRLTMWHQVFFIIVSQDRVSLQCFVFPTRAFHLISSSILPSPIPILRGCPLYSEKKNP